MIEPYYSDDFVTIYHGDCKEILPDLSFDVVITDPPYGIEWSQPERDSKGHESKGYEGIKNDGDTVERDKVLALLPDDLPVIMFGSPLVNIPAGTKQVLIWVKPPDLGFFGSVAGFRRDWESIYLIGKFEKKPAKESGIIKTLHSSSDYLKGKTHPHAKPLCVLTKLSNIVPEGVILDPFMGSGSTLRAAKDLGRKAIGIEIDEQYCEIAVKRLAQEVLFA